MLAIKKECWLLPRLGDGIKTLHNEPSTSKAVRRANTKEQEGKRRRPPPPPACHRLQRERKGGNKGGRKTTPGEQSGFLSPLFIKSLSFLRRCSSAFPLWRDRKPPPPPPGRRWRRGRGGGGSPGRKKVRIRKWAPGKERGQTISRSFWFVRTPDFCVLRAYEIKSSKPAFEGVACVGFGRSYA